jgi:group II intron reverse transcriptase/maturase
LADATKLVLLNAGSHGIDRVTCDAVKAQGMEFVRTLREKLATKTYRPVAVRRVYIPKRDGKRRPLGIPTVEDRVVQRALSLLLEAVYEQIFLPCSYGFRPGRSAVECVYDLAKKVYSHRYVVDADIEDFFGSVSHRKLLGMLREQIVDPRILKLIEQILRSGYFEGGQWQPTAEGTPQGGPLSPLLANVYLHYTLDIRMRELSPQRFTLYRYADDLVVACKSAQDVRFLVPLMRGWLSERSLAFHKGKSRAVDMSNEKRGFKSKFDFLGFKMHLRGFKDSDGRYWIARQPSERARKQLRANLKEKLRPTLSHDEAKAVARRIWRGWSEYFRYGNSNKVFYREQYSVSRALLSYLARKHRQQRCPVSWRRLLPIYREMFSCIRPVGVFIGPPGQKV